MIAGRVFAGAIAANFLVKLGIAIQAFFCLPPASRMLGDGFKWLPFVVAVLLIVDFTDETLRLREESSFTV